VDYLWSPWRYQYLTAPKKPDGCPFCRISSERDDEQNLIVHRAEHNFIVLNRYPYTSGHVMVVPYMHASDLWAINEQAAGEMMTLVRRSEKLLRELYRPEGINLGMNIGESAGAGIAGHIHMHVLARWHGDANFMTTVAETRILPEDLGTTWRRLHEAFGSR
jgi:ATP adenylyltransferase